MSVDLRKRLLRYAVLLVFLATGLYFFRQTPQDLTVTVDLRNTYRMAEAVISGVEFTVKQEDGDWVSTSAFDYPEELYPDGPGPVATHPVTVSVPDGTYVMALKLSYRGGAVQPLTKEYRFEVKSGARQAVFIP